MASHPIFSTIQQRYLDLTGQPDGTIDAFGNRNINLAVNDILNRYPFSWNVKTDTTTLSGGAANMPSDFNPRWPIDARIVASSTSDDNVFQKIDVADRDKYDSDSYVYWLTFDTTNNDYNFNSLTQSGTVTLYYHFTPSDMSSASDICRVPSTELVAYQASAKNWIPGERDEGLKKEYQDEANKYIQELWILDQQSGPQYGMNSIASTNLASTSSG